jgi:hypothetical protein
MKAHFAQGTTMIPSIPETFNYADHTYVLVGYSDCECITSVSHPRDQIDILKFKERMQKTNRQVGYMPKEEAMKKMYENCRHES